MLDGKTGIHDENTLRRLAVFARFGSQQLQPAGNLKHLGGGLVSQCPVTGLRFSPPSKPLDVQTAQLLYLDSHNARLLRIGHAQASQNQAIHAITDFVNGALEAAPAN